MTIRVLRRMETDAFKTELITKSETFVAKQYTPGINSMFWQLSKYAAQKLSQEQIDLLPEDEKLVVNTAANFIR